MSPADVSWGSVMDYLFSDVRGKDASPTPFPSTRYPGKVVGAIGIRGSAVDRHTALPGASFGCVGPWHHGMASRRQSAGATCPKKRSRAIHSRTDPFGVGQA